MTAYSAIGAKLVDQGYSAIPVLPGTKRPGAMSQGRWYGDMDWQRYCDRLPTEIETSIWARWPDAGVCVALGKASGNLVAIDVDTDSLPIQRAIESALPASPVQKAGRKGYTAFYRGGAGVVSRAFNVNGERVLDLLAHGKQTILPPTIHPDTIKPYFWLTADTLEHVAPDHLPFLADDIADKLGAALEPFGYYAPVERPSSGDADSLFREVNDRALERLDLWVPLLGIDAKRNHNGTWRGKAIWKGAENANVSFSSQGIKDFGSDLGMTAIDAVMAAHSSDFATAEKWLRDALGFREPPPVRLILKAPASVDVAPIIKLAPTPIYSPPGSVNPFEPKEAGGLLKRVAEWIYDNSIYPSRELSMLSAVSFMAVFAGRRYVGPTGLGTNMYLVGVARPGGGKGAPLAAVKTIIYACGMDWLYGSGIQASDSSIENMIRLRPSCLMTVDEVGMWFQDMSGRTAAPFQRAMKRSLLELYSASQSGGIWTGKDRAGSLVASSSEPVFIPTMSLLGMSTQTEFYKGITGDNLRDGLVARMTIIEARGDSEEQDIPPIAEVPAWLIAEIKAAAAAWPVTGNLAVANARNALANPKTHVVPWADGAKDRYKAIGRNQRETIKDDEQAAGIIGRSAEQSLKLATLRAVSLNPGAPEITVADLEWAWALVEKSIQTIEAGIKLYMAGSEFETNWKCILGAIKNKGERGVMESDLRRARGVSQIDERKFIECRAFLLNTGMINNRNGGKRYFAATQAEEALTAAE